MGSGVLAGGLSAYFHEFCSQAAKLPHMNCVEMQGGLFAEVINGIFRSRKVQVIAVKSCRSVDLLMFTNSVFRVRNVEICAVLSSKEVDFQILKNRFAGSEMFRYE